MAPRPPLRVSMFVDSVICHFMETATPEHRKPTAENQPAITDFSEENEATNDSVPNIGNRQPEVKRPATWA